MAFASFVAPIVPKLHSGSGLGTFTVRVDVEVWDGASYTPASPFRLDTGAQITTITTALASSLTLSTAGGRPARIRGVTGPANGLLVPFRFRFAAWPEIEIADTYCVVVPGEKVRGLLALRDIHPRFEFFKLGDRLFFVVEPRPG